MGITSRRNSHSSKKATRKGICGLSEKEAAELIQKWQAILRLRDWTIVTKFVKEREMTEPGRWAEVETNAHRMVVIISLLREEDAFDKGDFEEDDDPEVALVHELLHAMFFGVGDYEDKMKMQIEEQAVERLSTALVTLWRAFERRKKS